MPTYICGIINTSKTGRMQEITRPSDKGFQEVSIVMVVFSILLLIAVVADSVNVLSLSAHSDLLIMAVLAVINLLFVYTRGALRFYVGYRLTERIYNLFLFGWCTYLLYYLFDLLISKILIQ